MKIFVQVKTRAKMIGVEQLDASHFVVRVKSLPIEGQANVAVVETLAKYLKIPKTRIKISRGLKSKQKTLEIL